MLQKDDLIDNFSRVVELRDNVFRFEDVMPAHSYVYHLRAVPAGTGEDLLTVSQDRTDDGFALLMLEQAARMTPSATLRLGPLPQNAYGLSTLLRAPPDYHAYFGGRLDEKRKHLILCLPVHQCEFSGDESIEEFFALRRNVVPTLDWKREVHPKIVLRFDNPKTRGGTGDAEVLVKFLTLQREIDNLDGVTQGFIEVQNYKGNVVEILSPAAGTWRLIRNRDDSTGETISRSQLSDELKGFLTSNASAH